LNVGVADYIAIVQDSKPWTPEAPRGFAIHTYFGTVIFVVSLIAGLMMVLYSVRKLRNRRKIGEVAGSLL